MAFWVFALNCFTKSMMFTPWGPRAVPTGGAGVACPAGTCKNPAYGTRPNMCAAATDNIIDTCEVSTAGLIQNVLAPDVQMFDASGKYAPNKDNTMKDSLWYAFKGPINEASAAVVADYVMVDMAASVATGAASPEDAAAEAERRAKRYYKAG